MRSRALRHRAVAISTCVWGVLATAPQARAQVPAGGTIPDGGSGGAAVPRSDARVLDVTVVGGGDDAGPLMETIRELVGRLGFQVHPHFAPVPGDAGAPADMSVEVDLGSRYEALIAVRSGRTEIRRTVPRDGSPAVVREVLGEAVRSTVESQLLVDEARPAPPAAPPPAYVTTTPVAPAPAPETGVRAPESTSGLALDVMTFAGVAPVSSDAPVVPRIGGGLAAASRTWRRPSLAVTGAYQVPFDAESAEAKASVTIVSVRGVASLELWRTTAFALDAGVGGGVDVVEVNPAQRTQISTDSRTEVDAVVTGLLTGYLSLAPGLALTLIAGVEWDVAPHEYVSNVRQQLEVLKPWPVRPLVLAGFTFTALGSGMFPGRPR